jgi:hypothetical protein
MLRTQRLVLLPIALRNRNGAIIVHVTKQIIRHVSHAAQPSATVQERLETRLDTRPNLDPRPVARVGETDVVDVQILHNIRLIGVLTKGTNADAVRADTCQILDNDVGAVGFERDAI